MSECKLFSKPQYYDADFYENRSVSDHINEPGHRERLLEAAEQVEKLVALYGCKTLSDFGAGNGGLLHELKTRLPELITWGYDMSPRACAWASERYGVDVTQVDFTIPGTARAGDIVVMTESIEHLVDPHGVIEGIPRSTTAWQGREGEQFLIASSPAFETPEKHYQFHLWAWTGSSYADMIERAGWKIMRHFIRADVSTQFVVARRP